MTSKTPSRPVTRRVALRPLPQRVAPRTVVRALVWALALAAALPVAGGMAPAAWADRGADLTAVEAMREYYATLRGGGNIVAVRDKLVPVMKDISPKTRASVIRQINKGFDKKYGKDLAYHRCLAEILAAAGHPGISMLYKRYRGSRKDDDLRVAIAEVLGRCDDDRALSTLLKMVPDDTPEVAAAAVRACGSFAKGKEKTRKATMKELVAYYVKVTNRAGKGEKQRKLYQALKPAMNETLKAFSGGESLDSAEAWDAWLRENITRSWDDESAR